MKTTKTFDYGIALMLILILGAGAAAAYDATNVVVDFDRTSVDESLLAGESGVLNLVIENTGDYDAEGVQVWIQENTQITSSKKMYVGVVTSGETKTLPLTLRISENASGGLAVIPVEITYYGYDKDGSREKNLLHTSWQIPFRIEGDPLFQVTPTKTRYYKDTVDTLVLAAKTEDSVRNLQTTLESECLTIIGSAREYLGDVSGKKDFNITYEIKPTTEGACKATLSLSYADCFGGKTSDEIDIGLNIEESGVDFKVVEVAYGEAGPGETTDLSVTLKNVGATTAEDVSLTLGLSDPFSPGDTSEKYVGSVAAGEATTVGFKVATSWDADINTYTLPLTIEYKVGGTSQETEKDIGFDVTGKVVLEVINVEASGSSLKIDVANIGTRNAESVKATLVTTNAAFSTSSGSTGAAGGRPGSMSIIPGLGGQRQTNTDTGTQATETQRNRTMSNETQYLVEYKSDIKTSKQTTFTFSASVSGTATLILEYNGPNNQRVTKQERITIPGSTASATGFTTASRTRGGTDWTMYAAGAGLLLVIGFFGYRRIRKKKNA
jgi:hypothetical protein